MAEPAKSTAQEPDKPPPPGVGFVVDITLQRLTKLAVLVAIIAWALTHTSGKLLFNVPLALLIVAGLRWLALNVDVRYRGTEGPRKDWRRRKQQRGGGSSGQPGSAEASAPHKEGRWREKVRAPVVEHAWEMLCGSIIQQFVYDAWYGWVTPDVEFPADIRRALNSAFGNLAARARHVDLKAVLGDLSELVMEQMDLYRYTKESIQAGRGAAAFRDMSLKARDRALQQEMKAERNLHPALCTPDGHYKVMRAVSDGLAACLLDRSDGNKTMLRAVSRELLAAAVLRNVMFYFTPYTVNKMLLGSLQKRPQLKSAAELEEEARQLSAQAKTQAMKGHWEFEQRLRDTAMAEDAVLAQGRVAKHEARQRLARELEARAAKRAAATSPPNSVGDGPLAAAMKDNHQTDRHAHFEDGSGDSNDSSAAAHRHAMEYDEVADVAESHLVRSANPGAHIFGNVVAAMGHELAQESRSLSAGIGNVSGPASGRSSPKPAASAAGELPDAEEYEGFLGRPRAKVVAAELNNAGSKEIVMFIIRVADDSGEWSVARRFRNFETLHRAMRGYPAYRLRLPPKRIFFHSTSVDFVEERREQLDVYLRALLGDPNLCRTKDVWEFLSAWSEVYGTEENTSLLKAMGHSLDAARTNVRRFAGDVGKEFDMKRRKSFAVISRGLNTPDLPPGVTLQRQARSFSKNLGSMGSGSNRSNRRNSSSPTRLPPRGDRPASRDASPPLSPGRPSLTLPAPEPGPSRTHSSVGRPSAPSEPTAQPDAGFPPAAAPFQRQRVDGSSDAAMERESASGISSATGGSPPGGIPYGAHHSRLPSYAESRSELWDGSQSSVSAPISRQVSNTSTVTVEAESRALLLRASQSSVLMGAKPSAAFGRSTSGVLDGAASFLNKAGTLANSASHRVTAGAGTASKQVLSTAAAAGRKVKAAIGQDDGLLPVIAARGGADSATEGEAAQRAADGTSQAADGALAGDDGGAAPASDGGHLDFTPSRTQSEPARNLRAVSSSSIQQTERTASRVDAAPAAVCALDWEESAGISAPLYDIVDAVFELRSRGFFRRQIFSMSRQMLSLVAGDAIDVFLLGQLRLLREEHTLARLISSIQAALWPGGTWFMSRPEYKSGAEPVRVTAENFMEDRSPPPLDEDEIREALAAALTEQAPPALVRFVGKPAYSSGVQDVFDMMQSPTFVMQLGYGVLEILTVNVFPEMKTIFRSLEAGDL